MSDNRLKELKAAARLVTPQNIDTAERIEYYDDGSHVECPACGGEGHVELEADFCNYDNTAIGVQFYGIGNAHGAAEAYFRAASPTHVLSLIERLERAEAALATPAPLSDEPVALTEADVERQYHNGVHIGSGLPRATCPCGFCAKHRHGFNLANPSDKQEAVADMENAVVSDERMAGIAPGAVRRVLQVLGDILAAPPAESAEQDRIDAERYREVRQRAYLWGIDNPTPEKLDEQVDAVIKGASK